MKLRLDTMPYFKQHVSHYVRIPPDVNLYSTLNDKAATNSWEQQVLRTATDTLRMYLWLDDQQELRNIYVIYSGKKHAIIDVIYSGKKHAIIANTTRLGFYLCYK